MKKWLALLLTAFMLLTFVPSFAEGEHLTLTVAHWDIDNYFPDDGSRDLIITTIEEKFNVTFVPMNVGWGDYNDKYMAWAAAGTMPDICGGVNMVGGGTFFQWIQDGVVRELPDFTNYPNVAQYMDLPETVAYQVDGKNYFFPRMTYYDASYWCMDRGLYIRTDWLEALDLEMPTTGDELLECMRAFAEDDPDGNGEKDTIGFAYNAVFPTSQQIAWYGYTDGRWINKNGEWRNAAYEPEAIPLIDMLRTAYKNGWMDQDFTARATNDCRALFAAGRVGILALQNSPKHCDNLYDAWVIVQPDKNFIDCVAIVPLDGDNCYRFQEMAYWSETFIGGQVDDAKAERIMQIMDYLYSDEGMIFTSYGVEGTDFYYDENGNIVITMPLNENGTVMTTSEKYPSSGWLSSLAAWNGDLLQYVNPSIPLEIREMCTAEYERRIANWKSPELDWEVAALDLPEKKALSANTAVQWSNIIADASDTPTEELYELALAEWNSQGYEACWQAVTDAAADLLGK